MGQYLERYLAGECQPVWDELLEEGAAIREEPLASEAWAVAQETMRRVRHNIERLIPRLRALGYRFGEIQHDFGWEAWEREFVQAYPVFQPPPPETARLLDELEQRVGVLPLSIRAFYLEIGGVNFIGIDPWTPWKGYDPLFMYPLVDVEENPLDTEDDRDDLEELRENGEEGTIQLDFSPDAVIKYNNSGGGPYFMLVPNAGIDGVFHDGSHEVTFVEYLRKSLRSGGLTDLGAEKIGQIVNALARIPGGVVPESTVIEQQVKQVEQVLAHLQQDLLAI
jgi:hypothetical protein